MTPAQIISIVKDGVIILAVALLIYLFIDYGKDSVKIADIKALQQQLKDNQVKQEAYNAQVSTADAKHEASLADITQRINSQHDPVLVRVPGPTVVQTVPAKAADCPAQTGGVDIRPGVNSFELKYEKAIADCQAVLDKWPQ